MKTNVLDRSDFFKAGDENDPRFVTAFCAKCDALFQPNWRLVKHHAARDKYCRFCVPQTAIKGVWKP